MMKKNEYTSRLYCKSCKKYVKKKIGHLGKIWCSECNNLIEDI